jgi:DNA-binding LacI/PurR family transcriptional regulator
MKPVRRQALDEQVAELLTESIQTGRWEGVLPGVNQLAVTFHVSRETVRAALRLLETRGVLIAAGAGRSRVIAMKRGVPASRRTLRVAVLLNEPLENENAGMQRMLFQLQAAVVASGHECFFAPRGLEALGRSVRRVASLVRSVPADAWVVLAGSLEILEWFAAQSFPSLAIGGRSASVPIAGASVTFLPALREAARKLMGLGHRRIVMISPELWRHPTPGPLVRAFHEVLADGGIVSGEYHVPDWEESSAGLHRLLQSLFRVTPPTALIVVEPVHAVAVSNFLTQRGLLIGRDVSLVCIVPDPAFAWRQPPMAHFQWDSGRLIRRIVRWVGATARGRVDREQFAIPARFVPGGTVAAVARSPE